MDCRILRAVIQDVKRKSRGEKRAEWTHEATQNNRPLGPVFYSQVCICECNYRAVMTVLYVGRLAGSGVGNVPKYPTVVGVSASRNAARGLRRPPCKLTGFADTPSPLSQ
jgi:hypothetical protein